MKYLTFRFESGKSLIAWFIKFRTWGKWSHVDVWDDRTQEFIGALGTKGGVIRHNTTNPNYEYKYIKIPVEDYTGAMEWLHSQVGKGYDYGAILGFITRSENMANTEKWFCSELAAAALTKAGYREPLAYSTNRISPTHLVSMLSWIPGIKVD